MPQSLNPSSRMLRGLAVALAATALVACGSDDDDEAAAPAAGGAASTLSCETKQFDASAGATVPTAAQIAPFAKSYTSLSGVKVELAANGDLKVNDKTITVASTCLVKEPTGDMLMLSWGKANTVGAGAIVYDSHIDFRSSGISGIADGAIL